MKTKPHINIVGCGRLGKTLGRLWIDNDDAIVTGIYNRSALGNTEALNFIECASPYTSIKDLPPANLWLIATPDSKIEAVAHQLDKASIVPKQAVVFHCSGSLSSDVLQPLKDNGAYIASIHPAHSFADPLRSLQSFAGTWCAMEGDTEALTKLQPLFKSIGGKTFALNTEIKPLYHAALAVASNYLVTLLDISLGMLEKAGIARDTAQALVSPIVIQTAENVFASDTASALTGPIARGDIDTIRNHLKILTEKSPDTLSIYKQLGDLTLPLAQKQGNIDSKQVEALQKLLEEKSG